MIRIIAISFVALFGIPVLLAVTGCQTIRMTEQEAVTVAATPGGIATLCREVFVQIAPSRLDTAETIAQVTAYNAARRGYGCPQ